MTAPTEPRADLTPTQHAEMDQLFQAFGPTSPLRHAIAEGRIRRAGGDPFAAFEDLGTTDPDRAAKARALAEGASDG
jgi:hypothetical protein